MKLYHGSDQVVKNPRILETKRTMDFGGGFYTTKSEQQASDWARTVSIKRGSNHPVVTEYNYDESCCLKILVFAEPDYEWLDFVLANRNKALNHDYDIVVGPVADDSVYDTLFEYERGNLSKKEAIKKLKARKLDGQVLFHSTISLKSLTYVRDWEVK